MIITSNKGLIIIIRFTKNGFHIHYYVHKKWVSYTLLGSQKKWVSYSLLVSQKMDFIYIINITFYRTTELSTHIELENVTFLKKNVVQTASYISHVLRRQFQCNFFLCSSHLTFNTRHLHCNSVTGKKRLYPINFHIMLL